MRDYFEPMLGTTGALIAQFAITLVAILIVVLIVFWLIRRFTGGRFGAGGNRSRQPRLSMLDALPIDQRRRLVLVRRDNVEHLLLIGGPTDVVVETAIHRPPPAQRRADAQQPRPVAAAPARNGSPGEAQRAAMEPRRAEPASDFAPVEPEAQEAPVQRSQESQRHAESQRAAEPMPASLPEPDELSPPPEPPPAVQRQPQPQPPAARPARSVSGFLTGNRPRPAAGAELAAPRREARSNRVIETSRPLQRSTPSPFAREPVQAESDAEPPRSTVRPPMPPAPPIEASPFGDEPYGVPESAATPPLRFEPVFGRAAESEPAAEAPASESRQAVPVIEPPTRDDQPVSIEEAFGEEAPIIRHGESAAGETAAEDPASKRASQVGDLEKEMARLLGEISGGKR